MCAADGLSRRALQELIDLIPQPVILGQNIAPKRTNIDVTGGLSRGKVVQADATVIVPMDFETVVYKRVGFGLHGEWICERVT